MKIGMVSLLIMAFSLLGPVEAYSTEVLKAPQLATGQPRCHGPRLCDATGCYLSAACQPRPVCPPGNPCYPLYGAYGPYGGSQFWGAYTAAGW
jgi:hypothetical protein